MLDSNYDINTHTKGYRKLNGNSTDSSGQGNNGTRGGTEAYVAGKFGDCASFNGSSSHILCGGMPTGTVVNETISFWMKTTDITTIQYIVTHQETTGYSYGIAFQLISSGNIRFIATNAANSTFIADSGTGGIVSGVWSHVVGVKEGLNIKIYVNGVLKKSTDMTGSQATNLSANIDFGRAGSAGLYFNGQLDEIIVEDQAWTAQQVLNYYNKSQTRYFGEYLGAGPSVTKALRHFNETSGDALDSSGNGYTLTNVGTTPYVAGKFGNGISPAAGKYLNHTTFLDAGLTAWTVSCWIKTTQNVSAGSYGFIIYKGSTGNTRPIYMGLNENEKIWVVVSSGTTAGGPNIRTTTSSVNDGVWHNIVAQGSHAGGRASLKVFIDGSLNGSLSTSGGIDGAGIAADNTADFYFGQDGAGARAFLGIIDEFIIENRVRTATEIKKQYTMQKGRFGIL